jgi:hypothetical protein
MKYILFTLLLLAMFFAMMPFIMMFLNNLSKIKGNLTFKTQRRTKIALYVFPFISLILIIISIIVGLLI